MYYNFAGKVTWFAARISDRENVEKLTANLLVQTYYHETTKDLIDDKMVAPRALRLFVSRCFNAFLSGSGQINLLPCESSTIFQMFSAAIAKKY